MNTTNTPTNTQWALVTGASGGIGLSYVKELAKQQRAIILVARNESKLNEISADINKEYGVITKVIPANLSLQDGIDKVINAGKEESGDFLKLSSQDMLSSIALNCSAPMLLSHHFSEKMVSNGSSQILFLGSIVGCDQTG